MKKSVVKPLLGVVAAAGLLLTGCAPSGSTALVVGDERVSEAQIDAMMQSCAESTVPLRDFSRPFFLAYTGLGKLARQGHPVYEGAQVDDEYIEATMLPEAGGHPECKDFLRDAAAFTSAFAMAVEGKPENEIQEFLAEALDKIDFNPRYGTIYFDESARVHSTDGSLSTPAIGSSQANR